MAELIGGLIGVAFSLGLTLLFASAMGVPTVIGYILLSCAFRAIIMPAIVGRKRGPVTARTAAWTIAMDLGLIMWLLVVFL